MFKTLKDINVKGKRVLVLCDFNVPLKENGAIADDLKIQKAIPTLKLLKRRKAKVIILSHLGRPEGKQVKKLSLKVVQKRISELLNSKVAFVSEYVGKKVVKRTQALAAGEILLLENVRFCAAEKKNEPRFAKQLAELGDIYCNNAFSVSHRASASVVGVPALLPAVAGPLLEKEVRVLGRAQKKPWRPLVAIIGGAKIPSKIPLIQSFLETADHVLVGGKLANVLLQVKGIIVGKPWPAEEVVQRIASIELTSPKLHLPVDALASLDKKGKSYIRTVAPGRARNEEMILDIGTDTIAMFSEIIKEAKMIIWAGPLGFFEKAPFDEGTKAIADAIIRNHKAYTIVGGGDTVFALGRFGLREHFDHVSLGGSALLQFLSQNQLPGLKALGYYGRKRDKKS